MTRYKQTNLEHLKDIAFGHSVCRILFVANKFGFFKNFHCIIFSTIRAFSGFLDQKDSSVSTFANNLANVKIFGANFFMRVNSISAYFQHLRTRSFSRG